MNPDGLTEVVRTALTEAGWPVQHLERTGRSWRAGSVRIWDDGGIGSCPSAWHAEFWAPEAPRYRVSAGENRCLAGTGPAAFTAYAALTRLAEKAREAIRRERQLLALAESALPHREDDCD
jgi:hypothetical protein